MTKPAKYNLKVDGIILDMRARGKSFDQIATKLNSLENGYYYTLNGVASRIQRLRFLSR